MDQLENLLRGATSPGALAEVDVDRARELLGDDAAQQPRPHERAGQDARGRRADREPGRPLRAHAPRHPQDRLERARRSVQEAQPRPHGLARARAHAAPATSGRTTPSPTSSATRSTSHIERTVRNAVTAHGQGHAGAALARRLRDRAHRAPHEDEHRADARPVAVDADARQLPRRQEGGDGAALADQLAVPARLPRHRRLLVGGSRAEAGGSARGLVGLRVRHQHAARLHAEPRACWPAKAARSRSS